MADSSDSPFRRYAPWLRARYGGKTYRVSVDAGFSCPGREIGLPCSYCDAAGSRAPYLGDRGAITEQIDHGIEFLASRYRAERFLLYFQAFSNTYAPLEELRAIYDHALSRAPFVGLIVGTRPDCVDEDRAALLAEYRERGLDVWVELGLQSANDRTLERVRRGHTVAQFDEAVQTLHARGIHVAAHLILGLPGEGSEAAAESARHLSALPVAGVKFHNLVVLDGTELYREYRERGLAPPGAGEYEELLVAALEYLREDIVVMRFTCDPPRGRLHLPADLPDKTSVYNRIETRFSERGTRQGIYWRDHANEG
ncbi:MAG: TIGR01212 family radical SAM protein [Spirochaetota bacterium]